MLTPLLRLLNQISAYNRLADNLYQGIWPDHPLGVLNAARPALLAALHADLERPLFVITAGAERAKILAEQTYHWTPHPAAIYRLPDPGSLPYEKVAWSYDTIKGRLAVLSALALYNRGQSSPPLVITSARALMRHTLPSTEFITTDFALGQRIRLEEVIAHWVELGYRPEELVETPGSFSRRGGVLDIFPPNASLPIRIELFGDEIDSLRSFDPITQRSENRLRRFTVAPASETLPRYAEQAAERLGQWDFENLQPSTRLNFEEDIARLSAQSIFRGIEYYLPFFYNHRAEGVLDYLPEDTLLLIEDPEALAGVIDEVESQAQTLKEELTTVGDLPLDWPEPYFGWAALAPALAAYKPLILGFVPFRRSQEPPLETAPYLLQTTFALSPVFGGKVKEMAAEVVKRKEKGDRVILVSRQAERLSRLLDDQPVMSGLGRESPPPPSGSISLIKGIIPEGWNLAGPDGRPLITLMSDSELFGWKKPTPIRRRKPRRRVNPETFFADVDPGDLVVHIEHGIGRYKGLVRLDFEGVEREYLEVQYANTDKLYVPIHQADRLARYVGGGGDYTPSLNRLGSADWNTVKRRARRAVEDIAQELLEIYAKREVTPGRAFGPDTDWQINIEDSFPFVETEDQLQAIDAVKSDMEKSKPMDRLVCGDVGYGKTEVALRAAFKAVMDGVQVAVLVPTTVLAQQHYQTFTERLADYPVQIAMLSRFRTKSQQQQIIHNLAIGATDIVIGTHRLIQKDIKFKDMGLLIIDEEQRFGVKHKEKLKSMRANVDVLTLTATPIPRTLHMALSGVRDLSTIDTPPEERLPIQTTVAEYDEKLIRTALLRELERGGQVFYVYNRVMGIKQKANRIRNLLPEARVAVAHGQMRERQLERVMVDFVAGHYDVLVSTTIIESGLDMPNVNTIIIDRADRMGLAQLHQLRGRVGRGAVRAYAYLLIPKHYELNPDARKRLEAIAESTELGAGFRLAMRDLEIRGAGELLGARQHGQIAAVGFDLYTRLLAQAVRELQGDSPHKVLGEEAAVYLNPLSDSVQINLPLPAYMPQNYLPEEKLRLRFYRRMANLTTLEEIDEMATELEDRFGELPEPVVNLLYQLRLKILAAEGGVQAIMTEMGQIVIRADSLQALDRAGLERRLDSATKVTPRQIMLALHPDPAIWQAELEKALRLINRMLHDPAG